VDFSFSSADFADVYYLRHLRHLWIFLFHPQISQICTNASWQRTLLASAGGE
jgi:hypothetical protein